MKRGASRVKSAGLLPKIQQTPTECRKAFLPVIQGFDSLGDNTEKSATVGMPKGRTFFASGTETYHYKCRFVSAQRGKKTRSAASRYLRLRLENINRRLLFLKCHSKKEKERYAKREMRSSVRSAEYTTAHRLHSLRGRLGSGSSCSACALVVTDDSKKLRRPHRLALRRHAAPTRNRRLQSLSTSVLKQRCITGKIGGLIAENTSNAHRVPQSICQHHRNRLRI